MLATSQLNRSASRFCTSLHLWCQKYEQLFPVIDKMTNPAKSVILNQLLEMFPQSNLSLHEKCRLLNAAIQADSTILYGDQHNSIHSGRGSAWMFEPRVPDIPPHPMSNTYHKGYQLCKDLLYPQWLFFNEDRAYKELRELCSREGVFINYHYRDTSSKRIITRAVHQNWMGLMNTIGEFEILINLNALNPDDKGDPNAALVTCWGFEKNPSQKFPSPRTILKDAFLKITTRQGTEMFKPQGMSLLNTTKATLEKVRDVITPFLRCLITDLSQSGYTIEAHGPFAAPFFPSPAFIDKSWTKFSV